MWLGWLTFCRDGTLKQNDCPIWECGPNCSCPPECMNRVGYKVREVSVSDIRLFNVAVRPALSLSFSRLATRDGVSYRIIPRCS